MAHPRPRRKTTGFPLLKMSLDPDGVEHITVFLEEDKVVFKHTKRNATLQEFSMPLVPEVVSFLRDLSIALSLEER